MLNLVTRSGSNKFEFEFNATADADQLRFFRDSLRHPRPTPSTTSSTRPSPARSSRTSSGTSSTPRPTSPRTAGSATSRAFSPTRCPTQRIIQKGNDQADLAGDQPEQAVGHHQLRAARSSTTASPAWASTRWPRRTGNTQRIFLGAIWESVLRDDLIFRSQVGRHPHPRAHLPRPLPQRARRPATTSRRYRRPSPAPSGCRTTTTTPAPTSTACSSSTSWSSSSPKKLLGEHNLQLKNRFLHRAGGAQAVPPGRQAVRAQRPGRPLAADHVLLERSPLRGGALRLVHRHRHRHQEHRHPVRHLAAHPPPDLHPLALARLGQGRQQHRRRGHQHHRPGPRAWPRSGTPPTTGAPPCAAACSSYVDLDVGAIARHTIGGQTQRRCLWNAATSALRSRLRVQRRAAPATPSGCPAALPASTSRGGDCQQKLEVPRTWRSPPGAEREVVPGIALSLDFVHRKFNNQYEVNETNRIWTAAGQPPEPVRRLPQRPGRDHHRTSARPTEPSAATTASPSA